MFRHWLWICLLVLIGTFLGAEDKAIKQKREEMVSEHRVALVIGNATYDQHPLKNPVNDTDSIDTAGRQVPWISMKQDLWARSMGLEDFYFISYSENAFEAEQAYERGQMYYNEYEKVEKSYRKAAEQGHSNAQFQLGRMYYYRRPLSYNHIDWRFWWMFQAAYGYNDKEAERWFRKAAEQGHLEAQIYLGKMYYEGEGVNEDKVEAAKWFRKAAEQGHTQAQYESIYRSYDREDKGYYDSEYVKYAEEAEKWFRKAAEQGHTQAQYELGQRYYKEDEKAVKWYRKAAERGHPEAQIYLGKMYYAGKGVDKDEVEAERWFRKAAEQDLPEVQFQLGEMYYEERGADKDYKEAEKWFRKAAEQDHIQAQFLLGSIYYEGRGTDKDYKEAEKWLRKAAEQGHTQAQFRLGAMYYHGEGVTVSDTEAAKWFRKASWNSHDIFYVDLYLERIDERKAIEKKASDFTLQTLTGERFNLAEQQGRSVFLNFWATRCPPCLAEMPDIEKLQQTLGDSILIVGIDDEPADTVREFVQDRGYTWTFVLDPDNEVARTYDVSGIPTSVFIDAKGVIISKFVGQKDYETFLEAAREAIGN